MCTDESVLLHQRNVRVLPHYFCQISPKCNAHFRSSASLYFIRFWYFQFRIRWIRRTFVQSVRMNHGIYFIRVVRKHFVRDTRSVLIWQCGHVNSITYTLIRNDFGTTKTLFKSRSIRINRANLTEIKSELDTEDFQNDIYIERTIMTNRNSVNNPISLIKSRLSKRFVWTR